MHRLSRIVCIRGWQAAALVAMVSIATSVFGQVQGITAITQRPCDPSGTRCGALRPVPIWFSVSGRGLCTVRVDFGDGTPMVESPTPIDLSARWAVHHVYDQSWPGPKTIRAEGVSPCGGTATVAHRVFDITDFNERWDVAIANPTDTCYLVPGGLPPLRAGTKVTVSATSSPRVNFGCVSSGCVYDPDGKPSSRAPSRFPFPGFREFSLVLRVGSQVEQGGVSARTFTTTQRGNLEICLNDDAPRDNRGGWEVHLSVDQSPAPWLRTECLQTCQNQLNACFAGATTAAARAACPSQLAPCAAGCPPPLRAECLQTCQNQQITCLSRAPTDGARLVCQSQLASCAGGCPP